MSKVIQFSRYPFKVQAVRTPAGVGCGYCKFYMHPGGCPTGREERTLVGESCVKGGHHYEEVK